MADVYFRKPYVLVFPANVFNVDSKAGAEISPIKPHDIAEVQI
jgi:hypothetical protein